MTYTATKLDNGMHRIEMQDGLVFHVVVTNESQLDELVEFHLDFLKNPPTPPQPSAQPPVDLAKLVQEQQAIIQQLQADVAALKGAA